MGAREDPLSPWARGSPAKGVPKTQLVFSALAAPSALALRDTKVIRYKRGQHGELFNDTKIIMNKTVNIAPEASSPS